MHIAIYHPGLIPPPNYGGTERVLHALTKGLLKLGHQVTLIAQVGSSVEGAQIVPCPTYAPEDWENWIPKDADLVHFSATPHVLPKKPFLITIHGNGKPKESFHSNTVFLSKKHAENHGAKYFVYNGIDPDDYTAEPEREPYLVFLAKAEWRVKNLQGAVKVAKGAKLPIHVMGNRAWPISLKEIWRWGQDWIPGSRKIVYHGMVSDPEKVSLLRSAKTLLFPVRWHEPFGLAVLEALASGCPVFGTPYGSLPEIITPEVGLFSANSQDWIRALNEKKFDPEVCRKRVLEKFTHLEMAKNYVALYEEILKNGTLKQKQEDLYWRLPQTATALLPWQ